MKFRHQILILTTALSIGILTGCENRHSAIDKKQIDTDNQTEAYELSKPKYDALVKNFQSPPSETKPYTWYHVMNSNMSAVGITKDFESMAEAGIGGVLYFNLGRNISKGKVLFNSEKHIELIGHMASEAKRLGLTFGIHNADGWSSSGGPWNKPEHSMKQVTWNETIVTSNASNKGKVSVKLDQPMTMLDYYHDIAVLAYPSLPTDKIDAELKPVITASDPNFDVTVVDNIEVDNVSSIESKNGEPVWLQFTYEKPVTIRFASVDINWGKHINYELQYSHDGTNFKKHTDMRINRPGRVRWALDSAFEGITAKYFRIVADKTLNIFEARLASTPRMGNYLGRTSATHTEYHHLPPVGNPDKAHIIDSSKIIDLTNKLADDGRLTATLPEGDWTIMRFGYTAKGTTNIPPTDEGRGLEVDKFSRAAFKHHYSAYVTNVINKVKEVAPGVMQYLEIDSYEVGGQNWTQGYDQQFKQNKGYSLVPFLPLFAGKFVDSIETTEDVTWDIRDFSNKLITENYYEYFTELAHQDGLKTYTEPYGHGPFNELDAGSKVDIPMGEFWLKRNIYMLASAISVGHTYDRNIISAEAFTATVDHNWKFNPAYAKFDGDKTWALGVNEFVFHRFVHQANTHVVPGMTMDRWGAHIDATQPWFNTAGKAWFNYLSRGQYMLRQGQPVIDLLWYLGEATPTGCPDRRQKESKHIPTYINYDCLNTEKLNELYYQDKRFQLNHGVKYKILMLSNHDTLSFGSVQKIYQFAKQGGVIIGEPIKHLVGRDISPEQQTEFAKMVDFIWSQPTTHVEVNTPENWDNLYNKHGFNYDLRIKDIEELFYTHRKSKDLDIYFVYNDSDKRKLFDASFEVSGKIPELWDANTGKIKRIAAFDIQDGTTNLAFRLAPNESAFVVFHKNASDKARLSPEVIRQYDLESLYSEHYDIQLVATKNQDVILEREGVKNVTFDGVASEQILEGSWSVSFEKEYGLDQNFTFDTLINWKESTNPEIRAYSGIATYTKTFVVNAELLNEHEYIDLDLGKVSDSAQVFINGNEVGTAWLSPFTLDVKAYLQQGENTLTVKVANSWSNRLITDESLPDSSQYWQANGVHVPVMPDWYTNNEPLPNAGKKGHRRTFTTYKFVKEGDPLVDSGLLGPVTLKAKKSIELRL
ncbi:glycosyl hydrolase [Alteromonas sp. M12]|uniref:glycosyl hydrolase n=1 Tax=Alteromonas sp. M12 TaxID=3135644 RepID=UPI00319E0263